MLHFHERFGAALFSRTAAASAIGTAIPPTSSYAQGMMPVLVEKARLFAIPPTSSTA
jgi:hypothetical protein